MTEALTLSILAPKAVRVEWLQPEPSTAPMDCIGLDCVVVATNLPYTPSLTRIGAASLGVFDLDAPSAEQAAGLVSGRRYRLDLALRDSTSRTVEAVRIVLVFQ